MTLIVGIDENGLGPLLGPLLVTAAAFEAPAYDPARFWSLAGPELPADDSKALFTRNRPGPAELAVLAWLRLFQMTPRNFAELHRALVVSPHAPLPCKTVPPLCAPSSDMSLPLFASETPHTISSAVLDRFDLARIRPCELVSSSACPGLLNRELAVSGMNKFRYDFERMLDLVTALKQLHPRQDLHAICGKVGSTRRYLPWFDAMGIQATALEEFPERSTYQVDKLGLISFEKDADSGHLPVAVASMVGKYLRELTMHQLNRLLWDETRHASGYRDRITRQFVDDTRQRRQALDLPDECFTRNS